MKLQLPSSVLHISWRIQKTPHFHLGDFFCAVHDTFEQRTHKHLCDHGVYRHQLCFAAFLGRWLQLSDGMTSQTESDANDLETH